jgi:hypothetical protein
MVDDQMLSSRLKEDHLVMTNVLFKSYRKNGHIRVEYCKNDDTMLIKEKHKEWIQMINTQRLHDVPSGNK